MTDLWLCGNCGFVELENGRCPKCLSENVISEYKATCGFMASRDTFIAKDGIAKHWEEEEKKLHIVGNENRQVEPSEQKPWRSSRRVGKAASRIRLRPPLHR